MLIQLHQIERVATGAPATVYVTPVEPDESNVPRVNDAVKQINA